MTWHDLLPKETIELSDNLYDRVIAERNNGALIWPENGQIFRALQLTPPNRTKVVIIGQDPYHTPHQANGLAFSITPGHRIQPSLQNIFAELNEDLDVPVPNNGDLTPWAERGVLLLNTVLTVYQGEPNSHIEWGWHAVTKDILKVAAQLGQPIVFLAWGKNAMENIQTVKLDPDKLVLKSTHPSPYSYAKATRLSPAFKGSRPFSKTNEFLIRHGSAPIDWTLPDL